MLDEAMLEDMTRDGGDGENWDERCVTGGDVWL